MVAIVFKRTEGDGLDHSAVYIGGEMLAFNHQGKAALDLPAGTQVDVYWVMFGPPGSTLKVTKAVDGGAPVDFIDDQIVLADNGKKDDFKLLTV